MSEVGAPFSPSTARGLGPIVAQLRPGVHGVDIQGDLVLLDVPGDGYFCLPQAGVRVEPDGRVLIASDEIFGQLLDGGFLGSTDAPAAGSQATVAPLPAPSRTALQDLPRPSWRQGPEMARALVDVAVHYRGRPLSHLVALAQARAEAAAPPCVEDGLLRCVRSFHAWIPYAPVTGKCLLRSFMLLRHLRRAGYDAAWIFAVRTWPFGAHCWLQVEDLVLDDEPERLRPFHTILRL